MVDLLEAKLISAGKVPVDDSRIVTALNAVVADRAAIAKAPSRRRIVPAISIGLSLALLGTGAAAASQWGPWVDVPEPDLAFSREWTDVHGNVLGTCETRIAATSLSGEQRAAAQQFLASLDVGALEPDPEYVAGGLVAVGRGEEIGDLVDGARITDFSITHTGRLWPDHGNAAILQHALMMRVFNSMSADVIAKWPDLVNTLQSTSETQCTPDSNAVVIP